MLKWCACSAGQRGNYYTNEPIKQFTPTEEKCLSDGTGDVKSFTVDINDADSIKPQNLATETDNCRALETAASPENEENFDSCTSAVVKSPDIVAGYVSSQCTGASMVGVVSCRVGGRVVDCDAGGGVVDCDAGGGVVDCDAGGGVVDRDVGGSKVDGNADGSTVDLNADGRKAISLFRLHRVKQRRKYKKKLQLQKESQQGLIYRSDINEKSKKYLLSAKSSLVEVPRSHDIIDEVASRQGMVDLTSTNAISSSEVFDPKNRLAFSEDLHSKSQYQVKSKDCFKIECRPGNLTDYSKHHGSTEAISNIGLQGFLPTEREMYRLDGRSEIRFDDGRVTDTKSKSEAQLAQEIQTRDSADAIDTKNDFFRARGSNNLASPSISDQIKNKSYEPDKSLFGMEVIDVQSEYHTDPVMGESDSSPHSEFELKKGDSLPLIDTCTFTNKAFLCNLGSEEEKTEGAAFLPRRELEKNRLMTLTVRPVHTTRRYEGNPKRENSVSLKRKPTLALSNRLYKMVSKFDECNSSTNQESAGISQPNSADATEKKYHSECSPQIADTLRDTKLITDGTTPRVSGDEYSSETCLNNVPELVAEVEYDVHCSADANDSKRDDDLGQTPLENSKDGIGLKVGNEKRIYKITSTVKAIKPTQSEELRSDTKKEENGVKQQNTDWKAANEIRTDYEEEDSDQSKIVYHDKEIVNSSPTPKGSVSDPTRASKRLLLGNDIKSSEAVICSSSGALVSPKFRENLNKLKEFYDTIITDFEDYVRDNSENQSPKSIRKMLPADAEPGEEGSTLNGRDDGATNYFDSSSLGVNTSEKSHSSHLVLDGNDVVLFSVAQGSPYSNQTNMVTYDKADNLSPPAVNPIFYAVNSKSTGDSMNASLPSSGGYAGDLSEWRSASRGPAAIYSLSSVERQRNDPISDEGICQRSPEAALPSVASSSNETESSTVLQAPRPSNIDPNVVLNFLGTLDVQRDVSDALSNVSLNLSESLVEDGPNVRKYAAETEVAPEENDQKFTAMGSDEYLNVRLRSETMVSSENLKAALNSDESFAKEARREDGDELSNGLFTLGQFAQSEGWRDVPVVGWPVRQTAWEKRSLGGKLWKRCRQRLDKINGGETRDIETRKEPNGGSGFDRIEKRLFRLPAENFKYGAVSTKSDRNKNSGNFFSARATNSLQITSGELSEKETYKSTQILLKRQEGKFKGSYLLNSALENEETESQGANCESDLREFSSEEKGSLSCTETNFEHNDVLLNGLNISAGAKNQNYDKISRTGLSELTSELACGESARFTSIFGASHFTSIHLTPNSRCVFTTLVVSTACPPNLNTLDPYDCCTFSSSLSRPIPSVLPVPQAEVFARPQLVSNLQSQVSTLMKPIAVSTTPSDSRTSIFAVQPSVSDQRPPISSQQISVFNSDSRMTVTDHPHPLDESCLDPLQQTTSNPFMLSNSRHLNDVSESFLSTFSAKKSFPLPPPSSFSSPVRDSEGDYSAHPPVYSHMRLPSDIPKSFLHSCKAPKPPPPEPPPKPTRLRRKEATREVQRACQPRQHPDKKKEVSDNIDLPLPTVVERRAWLPAVKCVSRGNGDQSTREKTSSGRVERENIYCDLNMLGKTETLDSPARHDEKNEVPKIIAFTEKKKTFDSLLPQYPVRSVSDKYNEELMCSNLTELGNMQSCIISFQQSDTQSEILEHTQSFGNDEEKNLHSSFPCSARAKKSFQFKGDLVKYESQEFIPLGSGEDKISFSEKTGKCFNESSPNCSPTSNRRRSPSFGSSYSEMESDPLTFSKNYSQKTTNILKQDRKRSKLADQFFRYSVWKRTRFKKNEDDREESKENPIERNSSEESVTRAIFPSCPSGRIQRKSSQSMMQLSKRRASFDHLSKDSSKMSFLKSPGKNSGDFYCNSPDAMLQRAVHLLEAIEKDHDDCFSGGDCDDLFGLQRAASSPSLVPHGPGTARVVRDEPNGGNEIPESQEEEFFSKNECPMLQNHGSRFSSECLSYDSSNQIEINVDDCESVSRLIKAERYDDLDGRNCRIDKTDLKKETNKTDISDVFSLRSLQKKTSDSFELPQQSRESRTNRSAFVLPAIIPSGRLGSSETAASERERNELQKFPSITRSSSRWSSLKSLPTYSSENYVVVRASSSADCADPDGNVTFHAAISGTHNAAAMKTTPTPEKNKRKERQLRKEIQGSACFRALYRSHSPAQSKSAIVKVTPATNSSKSIRMRNVRWKEITAKQLPKQSTHKDTPPINNKKRHLKARKSKEDKTLPHHGRKERTKRSTCEQNPGKKFAPSFARKYSCCCCCCKHFIEKTKLAENLVAPQLRKETRRNKGKTTARRELAIVHLDYHRSRRPGQRVSRSAQR